MNAQKLKQIVIVEVPSEIIMQNNNFTTNKYENNIYP